jgi:putative PIN family toxin of toxin-antitoxin system
MRVVFDTNIFISAFAIPGGRAEEAFRHALHGRFELFTSVAILTESTNILRLKFDWAEDRVRRFLNLVGRAATVLKTSPSLRVLRDDPDNRILECADAAEADLIVTGDRHLLALRNHGQTAIISLADLLTRLEPPES